MGGRVTTGSRAVRRVQCTARENCWRASMPQRCALFGCRCAPACPLICPPSVRQVLTGRLPSVVWPCVRPYAAHVKAVEAHFRSASARAGAGVGAPGEEEEEGKEASPDEGEEGSEQGVGEEEEQAEGQEEQPAAPSKGRNGKRGRGAVAKGKGRGKGAAQAAAKRRRAD